MRKDFTPKALAGYVMSGLGAMIGLVLFPLVLLLIVLTRRA